MNNEINSFLNIHFSMLIPFFTYPAFNKNLIYCYNFNFLQLKMESKYRRNQKRMNFVRREEEKERQKALAFSLYAGTWIFYDEGTTVYHCGDIRLVINKCNLTRGFYRVEEFINYFIKYQ